MAATYGPADGLKTGTRDVAPFLRALLQQEEESEVEDMLGSSSPRADSDEDREGLYIPLMDGKSMNAIFGDVSLVLLCVFVEYV